MLRAAATAAIAAVTVVAAVTAVVTTAVVVGATSARAEASNEWVAHMDGLGATLGALLTDASSTDADRALRLRKEAETMKLLAHGVSAMGKRPDADPTIAMLIHELEGAVDDVDHAKEDRVEDAALAVAWTCMGCHTRSETGTPRPLASLAPVNPALSPEIRAITLAATRRFTAAETAFHEAVYDEDFARKEPTRWERAVKGALIVDLRVMNDPREALDIVDRVLNTPDGEPLWEDASAWRRVLLPMVRAPRETPKTLAALEAEAQRLVDQALTTDDAGKEILFLRATAVVHELLMKGPPHDMKAEALSLLGVSYRGLKDLDIWSLHLVYDAACVEEAPHSKLAEECYARWRDDARAYFTGNGGAPLPPELAAQAAKLKGLAAPRAPAKAP